jgi:chemotaxis protein MotB
MVLIFLITVFVISEVLIGREMMGKDSAIGQLQRIVEHLEGLAGRCRKGSGAVARAGARAGNHGRRAGSAAGAIARRTGGGAGGAGGAERRQNARRKQTVTSVRSRRRCSAPVPNAWPELERLNQALAANQQELAPARRGDRRAKGQD